MVKEKIIAALGSTLLKKMQEDLLSPVEQDFMNSIAKLEQIEWEQ